MKPVKQTKDNNCFPACLASLLEIPIKGIPCYPRVAYQIQIAKYQKWLRRRGLSLLYMPVSIRRRKPVVPWAVLSVPAYCIVGVETKDSFGHVMVGKIHYKSIRVIHDPANTAYIKSDYTIDSVLLLIEAAK